MLKRIEKHIGKELIFIKEVYEFDFPFADTQYLLRDRDGIFYLLIISTDNLVDSNPLFTEKLFNYFIYLFKKPIKHEKIRNKFYEPKIVCDVLDSSRFDVKFALNRFDILFKQNCFCLTLGEYKLPFFIENNCAILGTWNNYIDRQSFLLMVDYIFNTYKTIKTIKYKNILFDPVVCDSNWRHPDFYIPLPKTKEELFSRLSKKPRQRTKRERTKIIDDFGKLSFENIPFKKTSSEIVNLYYKFAFNRYGITKEKSDISKRHLTDTYILRINDRIAAVDFVCEQGKIAYWECGSYDADFSDYSCGKVLYGLVLEKMIEKGLEGVSIGSIPLDYKKHYGSIEFIANSGVIQKQSHYLIKYLIMHDFNIRNFIFRFKLFMYRFHHKERKGSK